VAVFRRSWVYYRQWRGGPVRPFSSPVTVFEYVASGGLTIGGAADVEFKKAAAAIMPMGGFAFPVKPVHRPRIFSYIASGGLRIGGAADTEFRPVQVFEYTFESPRRKIKVGGPGAEIEFFRVVDADEEILLSLMLEDEI